MLSQLSVTGLKIYITYFKFRFVSHLSRGLYPVFHLMLFQVMVIRQSSILVEDVNITNPFCVIVMFVMQLNYRHFFIMNHKLIIINNYKLMTSDLNWMQTHCPAALLPWEMPYRKLSSHPSIEERDSWLQLPFECVFAL